MEEDQRINGYLSKTRSAVNQMKACGESVTDQQVVGKVMKSQTSKFGFIVVAIQESKRMLKLWRLKNFNILWKHMRCLWLKEVKKGPYNKHCKLNLPRYDKYWKKKDKGKFKKEFDKRKVQCYNSKKLGHYADECCHKKGGKKNQKGEEKTNMAQDNFDSEVVLFMATNCEGDPMCEVWYISHRIN